MSPPVNPPQRFSGRVDYYRKYRPGYPASLIDWLTDHTALPSSGRIADVGSGTGLLAELFLRRGYEVFGVEPNPEMRRAAESHLKPYPNFRSVEGWAEATTLGDQSVDLIVAGQSFHWFELDRTRGEFRRILTPSACAVLVWNQRKTERTGFLRAYEDLLLGHGIDYRQVRHQNIEEAQLATFLGPEKFQKKVLANSQVLDREGLIGRTLSCSFAPLAGHPGHEPLMQALDEIFDAWQVAGRVTLEYETLAYAGSLRPVQD